MREVLAIVLPKIIPQNLEFKVIAHEGKSDLERSIPRKLKAWRDVSRFIILRDKDSGDCFLIKEKLKRICREAGREDTLIRIVCCELESWFLGDLAAIESAYEIQNLSKQQEKKKYRTPDTLVSAKSELKRLIPQYQPILGSKKIAPYLTLEKNTSKSFNVFIQGINLSIQNLNPV